MTTRTDYSDEEWKNIMAAPIMAGLYVAMAVGSGPIDTLKEASSIAHSLTDLVQKGSANELISAWIDEIKPKEGQAVQMKEVVQVNAKTVEELRSATIDTLQQANAALAKATPDEAAEYKQIVMTISQRVAEAGKEGGFLGIGGTRVSPPETNAMQEIAAAIGTAA